MCVGGHTGTHLDQVVGVDPAHPCYTSADGGVAQEVPHGRHVGEFGGQHWTEKRKTSDLAIYWLSKASLRSWKLRFEIFSLKTAGK